MRHDKEGLDRCARLGCKQGIAWCLGELAMFAEAQGHPRRASPLFGAADGLREATGDPPSATHAGPERKLFAAAQEALGEEGSQMAWMEGRAISLEQAVEFALEQPSSS